MKKINKRLKSFLLAILIVLDIPLIGYNTALAADGAAYRTGLAPLETLVAAIAIGSGIVAYNSGQAINNLVNNVCTAIKDNTVRKAQEDPAFESPYRVIQGGDDPTPEDPDNNNKNGRWFGVVGASALGSSLLFEKGAVEEIMQTIKEKNGYSSMYTNIGTVSADSMISSSSASNIALQLANISNSAVKQFDDFLHSDFFSSKNIDPSDCIYSVGVRLSDVYNSTPYYPELNVIVTVNNSNVKYVGLTGNPFVNGFFSNSYGSASYIYSSTSVYDPILLNNDLVSVNLRYFTINIPRHNSQGVFSYSSSPYNNTSRYLTYVSNNFAYAGYKWFVSNPWTFTNQVYNSDQTFSVNFPSWVSDSINLLGKQIDAINLGIQNLTNMNWAQTQTQIQTAPASEAAVSQAINNWENPAAVPDPDPNPNPDPDPDPEPNPEEDPVNESAINEGAQSIYDWVSQKITLPSGIFEKIPFSIPYDLYLLLRAMFPTSGSRKKTYLKVSNVQSRTGGNAVLDPAGITISSHFEAASKNTKSYNIDWKPAPVINLDLHFSYGDVGGQKKTLDIVKMVDLQPYSYFAMIVYIAIYIAWLFAIFGWILESFK